MTRRLIGATLDAVGSLENGTKPAAVHRCRVLVSKLRVCLVEFGRMLPQPETERAAQGLRRLRRLMAPLRDLQVMRSRLAEFPARTRGGTETKRKLEEMLEGDEADISKQIFGEKNRRTFEELKRELRGLKARLRKNSKHPFGKVEKVARVPAELGWRLADLHRRFHGQWERFLETRRHKDLHEARIAGKKLRYALELLRDIEPASCGALAERLEGLHSCAGDIRDLDLLEARIKACGKDGIELEKEEGRRRATLERGLRRIEKDFASPSFARACRNVLEGFGSE